MLVGRRHTISSIVLIVVLLIHILFLLACSLYTITYNKQPEALSYPSSDSYIYIPMSEQPTPPAPTPINTPINNQPPIPEPLQEQQQDTQQIQPEDLNFASLFQENEPTAVPEEPADQKKENAIEGKHGDIGVHITDTDTSIQKEKPENPAAPPKEVATDDIPMPFVGINTTELSERDTLFHQFIKAVNTAIHTSMNQSNPPYTPGAQPVLVRLVIIRTGKLAQAPTILRSSGNPQRDAWYINAIQQASTQFPPIPPAIRLPFAELTYKEGMRAGSPIR